MTIYVAPAQNVVIANGQQNSSSFVVQDYTSGSFQVPAAITGLNFTVQVSNDNANFTSLENAAGSAVAVIPVTANEVCPLPVETFNFKYARLRSASAEAAERTIPVFLKSVG